MSDEITTGDQGQPVEDTPTLPDVPAETSTTSADIPVEMGTPTDVAVELPSQVYVLAENEQFVEVNGRKLIEVKDVYKNITFHKTDKGGNLLGIDAGGCLVKL